MNCPLPFGSRMSPLLRHPSNVKLTWSGSCANAAPANSRTARTTNALKQKYTDAFMQACLLKYLVFDLLGPHRGGRFRSTSPPGKQIAVFEPGSDSSHFSLKGLRVKRKHFPN